MSYSENFRMFNKKTNRLNELLESFGVKTQFSDVLNRQENKRINDCIEIIKKEVKIYKNILKLKYDNELVEKYKQEMRSEKYENYKTGLLESIKEIALNPDKWEKLDPVRKEDFFNMTRKYDVRVRTHEDIEEERREKERILQEQYEMERQRKLEFERIERERNANKGMTIQINQGGQKNAPEISIMPNQIRIGSNQPNTAREELGLKEREENEDVQEQNATEKPRKRLSIVETNTADSNDKKLDDNLMNIYNKKRMSYVPVKKINDEQYQFGTQNIDIKVDGDTIRVKSGNGYILLEKFVDIFGPVEEQNMLNAFVPNLKVGKI